MPASAGLHAYKLGIKTLTVNGQDAAFELRPYLDESLPENVLQGTQNALQCPQRG